MNSRLTRLARSHVPAIVALAALNLSISWRLFKVEYTDHFSSIEGAWVGLARYLSRHWGDFSWWPLWHCGMPYQDTYVPLLHLVAAATATIFNFSAAHAYHVVTGVAYAFGPVTLYLMVSRLGAARGSAFLSALFYSLFSPCTLLMPDMARDVGGFWFSRRLQVMVVYGEGPHISAMTLLPVAILALHWALQTRSRRAFALAALPLGAIFLTNVPGTMATGLAVFCWLCIQPAGERRAAWTIAGTAAAFGYCLACYGLPPSSLRTVFGNVGSMHAGFSATLRSGPFLLGATLAGTAGLGWLLTRARLPLVLRFAVLNFAVLTLMVLSAQPEKFELLPQVGRLHLELEMGACLILGSGCWFLYRLAPGWIQPVVLALCLSPVYLQFQNYRARARRDIQPVAVATRSEYTSARWVDGNLPGRRTYVVGSTSFWWNAFTDTPQALGCCAQNQSMPILDRVPYLVNTPGSKADTEKIIPYLQAIGAQSLVASGPESTDEYKDIKSPERFDALLPMLHRERGDTIYAVPQRTTSLAHVVRPGEAVPPPETADQSAKADDIVKYAAALQDPAHPAADFTWLRGDTARISATLAPGDLVSVQIAWFRGWKAQVAGRSIPIRRDGMGFQLLQPGCTGPCEITLHWAGRPDRIPSAAISLGALAFCAFLVFGAQARRPGLHLS